MTEKTIDPNDAVDFMYSQAVVYAQAKANRFYLEEYRKTCLLYTSPSPRD